MNNYRVVTKQYVYQVAEIRAQSREEAETKALDDAIDWDWCDYGNYEIESVEEV
jgi:hypothetical protein